MSKPDYAPGHNAATAKAWSMPVLKPLKPRLDAVEMLAEAADRLGYKADADALRRRGNLAFIQVNAALAAIEAVLSQSPKGETE